MSCSVCLDGYTQTKRRCIDCPYCTIGTCNECMKKLALMWASNPKCASCNKTFTAEQIDQLFSKQFRRGDLRIQIIKNLQEQEMSLLPATSEYIKECENRHEYTTCIYAIQTLHQQFEQNVLQDLGPHIEKLTALQNRIKSVGLHDQKKKDRNRKSFKCPKNDCLGYITNEECGLCHTVVCSNCNLIKLIDHECNENDVLSWKLIKESTVGCPKCSTRIQKVSGCNQMWCTIDGCNTAFDWTTGLIVNGPVHNPHYFEWLTRGASEIVQRNGPVAVDIACQGPRDVLSHVRVRSIMRYFSDIKNLVTNSVAFDVNRRSEYDFHFLRFISFVRCISEAADHVIYVPQYGPETHRQLRVDYLKKNITKAEWASKMSNKETLRYKKLKLSHLHLMFQTASADIFSKILTESESIKIPNVPIEGIHSEAYTKTMNDFVKISILNLCTFNDSLENLRVYFKNEMVRILSDYSDKTCRILDYANPKDPRTLMWTESLISNISNK